MKKIFLLYILILTALFAASCVSEIPGEEPTLPTLENGFYLKLDVQGNGVVGTRATTPPTLPAEKGEEDVTSLYLLFFDAATGDFEDWIDASPTQVDGEGNIVPLNMATPLKIDLSIKSLPNKEYRILVVANIHAYMDENEVTNWLYDFVDTKFSEAQAKVLDGSEVSTPISGYELLMTSSVTRRAGQEMVHTNLLRSLVRFDLEMNIPGQILRSVSVWNVPKSTALWNNDFNDYRSHFEKFDDSNYDFDDARNNNIFLYKGVAYSFENSVTGSYANDNFTTCLILGIEAGGTGRITYYRLNVHESGAQLLKRNYVYQITITRVLGLGDNTEHDAYTGAATLLDVTVRNWQDGGQGGVMFDGEDILAIGANRIDFTGDGGDESVTIFTFSPDADKTLQVIGNDLPTGIRIVSMVNNTLTVEADPTTVARGGFIELAFGTMRGSVQVAQSDKQNLFLELSVGTTEIPPFDKGAASEMDGSVKVTSSGPWTAELYNGKFKFSSPSQDITNPNVPKITGINGDTFTLATLGGLNQPESHFAFVIVSLDADPDINRVLVLQQEGEAYINLVDPNDANLVFTPAGQPTPENALTPGVHKVYINAPAGTPWDFSLSGQASSLFEIVGNAIQNDASGDYLEIRAKGDNPMSFNGTAVVTAYLEIDPSVRVQINLVQQAHFIAFNPTSVPIVPVTGGTTQSITVNSSANFTLAIEMQEGSFPPAYASRIQARITPPNVTNGTTGQTFTVTFDPLPAGLFGITPVAIVTATINGTSVRTSMSVQQGARTPRNIRIVTANSGYYAMGPNQGSAANRRYVSQLATQIANNSSFGPISPPATVFSGAREFVAGAHANPATANADVYMFNDTRFTAAQGTAIRNWLQGSKYRVLIMASRANYAGINNLGMGYTVVNGGSSAAHTIPLAFRPGNGPGIPPTSSRLAAYLFRDGPFTNGTDISPNVVFRPNNANGAVLTQWPSTFIPLIYLPGTTNRCVFGIDPVNRVIFMGNSIFGATSNWNIRENVLFMQNLSAWIVENTQHGDVFNAWFSGPPTIP